MAINLENDDKTFGYYPIDNKFPIKDSNNPLVEGVKTDIKNGNLNKLLQGYEDVEYDRKHSHLNSLQEDLSEPSSPPANNPQNVNVLITGGRIALGILDKVGKAIIAKEAIKAGKDAHDKGESSEGVVVSGVQGGINNAITTPIREFIDGIADLAITEDEKKGLRKAAIIMDKLPSDQEALIEIARNQNTPPVIKALAEAKFHLQNSDHNTVSAHSMYYNILDKVVKNNLSTMSDAEYNKLLNVAENETSKHNALSQAKEKPCPSLECKEADTSNKTPSSVGSNDSKKHASIG